MGWKWTSLTVEEISVIYIGITHRIHVPLTLGIWYTRAYGFGSWLSLCLPSQFSFHLEFLSVNDTFIRMEKRYGCCLNSILLIHQELK